MKKGNRKFIYTSKAAHLLVMSELLCRGWNVSIPEVDVGDDIFVVKDKTRDFIPVQVKYSVCKNNGKGRFSSQFQIPIKQIEEAKTPDLVYIFVTRYKEEWKSFIIISRRDIDILRSDTQKPLGTINKKYLHLTLNFVGNNKCSCSKVDLKDYLNNWNDFPLVLNP